MKQEYLEKCILELDAMIATFQQAMTIGGRTLLSERESQACELLKDARLKLTKEIDSQDAFDIGMERLREQEAGAS